MNLTNLIEDGKLSVPASQALARLFDQLGLPASELNPLTQQLVAARKSLEARRASRPPDTTAAPDRRAAGLAGPEPADGRGIAALRDAPARAHAPEHQHRQRGSDPGHRAWTWRMADATRLVNAREQGTLQPRWPMPRAWFPLWATPGSAGQLAVNSRFFEVRGRVRLDQAVVEEVSVVQRDGVNVRTLSRVSGGRRPPRPRQGKPAGLPRKRHRSGHVSTMHA
jgi:general secretion pathway protein K